MAEKIGAAGFICISLATGYGLEPESSGHRPCGTTIPSGPDQTLESAGLLLKNKMLECCHYLLWPEGWKAEADLQTNLHQPAEAAAASLVEEQSLELHRARAQLIKDFPQAFSGEAGCPAMPSMLSWERKQSKNAMLKSNLPDAPEQQVKGKQLEAAIREAEETTAQIERKLALEAKVAYKVAQRSGEDAADLTDKYKNTAFEDSYAGETYQKLTAVKAAWLTWSGELKKALPLAERREASGDEALPFKPSADSTQWGVNPTEAGHKPPTEAPVGTKEDKDSTCANCVIA